MSYPKIYEVLPKDIILQIQDYIEGEVIYIPKRSENKKSWGDCTDTKEILSLRNKKIYYDYCDGISVQQLAQKYFWLKKAFNELLDMKKIIDKFHPKCDMLSWRIFIIKKSENYTIFDIFLKAHLYIF